MCYKQVLLVYYFHQVFQAGPTFDYNSVKEVLEVVLLTSSDAQTAAAKVAYASEVVHYLLEKQVVCSAMVPVPGGLLGALRARGDWVCIFLVAN